MLLLRQRKPLHAVRGMSKLTLCKRPFNNQIPPQQLLQMNQGPPQAGLCTGNPPHAGAGKSA